MALIKECIFWNQDGDKIAAVIVKIVDEYSNALRTDRLKRVSGRTRQYRSGGGQNSRPM